MKNLETKRLFLRPVTLEHAPSYQKYFNDYEVIRYLSHHVPWPFPEDGVENFFKNDILPIQGKDRWLWGIFLKENPDELIGAIDLWREEKPENRGFWLARKYWGQSIMTEACEEVIRHAFCDLGFERLIFANAVGNIASRKVKMKTGAKQFDIRPAKFVDPKFTEHELWILTKSDWLTYQNSTSK